MFFLNCDGLLEIEIPGSISCLGHCQNLTSAYISLWAWENRPV